jgi:hypothetical protein
MTSLQVLRAAPRVLKQHARPAKRERTTMITPANVDHVGFTLEPDVSFIT